MNKFKVGDEVIVVKVSDYNGMGNTEGNISREYLHKRATVIRLKGDAGFGEHYEDNYEYEIKFCEDVVKSVFNN